MKRCIIPAVIAAVLVVVSLADGARLVIEPTDVVKMAPPAGALPPRYVVAVALPAALEGATVDFAQLSFTAEVQPATGDSLFAIEGYALITEWSSGAVSWTSPWSHPGGDLDEHSHTAYVGVIGDTVRASVDVTHILQSWVDGDLRNEGILLKVPGGSGHGVVAIPEAHQPPRIEIWYSPATR